MSAPWMRVKAVFQEALDLPPETLAAFLDEACGADADLRAQVERLLASDRDAERFLETPAAAAALHAMGRDAGSDNGLRIGPYTVVAEIGRGGMGTVYKAARADEAFERLVAIKVIKRGMDTAEIVRRFRHERQTLADLNHPNIARLFDGGATPDGLPYFVMEYVDGQPIDEYCTGRRASIDERLALFRSVCAAVQVAHQNLVVHRDLKPDNILVTGEGVPKLVDFGIAKVLDPMSPAHTEGTSDGRGVMTLRYASPEQVRGGPITTACDVYALGVVLYELLIGGSPYEAASTDRLALEHAILDEEPLRPSTAVSRRSIDTPLPAVVLRKRLAGDLDNIVLKALRKDPHQRYASVGQFSEDIRRHIEGLPVVARGDTFWYRASTFARRHRLGVAAAAAILLALVGGVAGIAWQARVAARERDAARVQQAKAERLNAFLKDILGFANAAWYSPNVEKGYNISVKELLDLAAARIESEMADQPEIRAEMQQVIGAAYIFQSQFDLAEHHLRAALDAQVVLHGDDSMAASTSRMLLGDIRLIRGNYTAALAYLERAVAGFRRLQQQGKGDPRRLAAALSDIGSSTIRLDLARSEAAMREGLSVARSLQGNDRSVTAILSGGLAFVRLEQGNLNEAEPLARASIDEFGRLTGRPRWERATGFRALGVVQTLQGRFAEADVSLASARTAYEEVWGESSLYVAATLSDQAFLRYKEGRYAEAEALVNDALRRYRKSVAEDHPTLVVPTLTLGLILHKTGRTAEAEPLLRRGVSQASPRHPRTMEAKALLARN